MRKDRQNWRAWTAQPNTPLTDMMDVVPHVVSYTLDGESHTVNVDASEPMEAIKLVQYQLEREDQEEKA